ncbi:MAG TPA: hypothetical protein VF008_19260 [Niastella sp.]
MNLLPTYEQMIAERQDGIEIPDMADAIWVRIETALDVELPVHDTPAAPPGKPFFKHPAVWMISASIIAIIIALFFLSRNRRTTPPPQRDQPQHTKPTIKPDTIMKQGLKPPDPLKPVREKNTGTINEKHVADTTAHSAFINEKTDSLLKTSPVILAPPAIKIPPPGMMKNPSLDLKQRPKYGVEVSDSDYRFKVKPKE